MPLVQVSAAYLERKVAACRQFLQVAVVANLIKSNLFLLT